MQGLVAARVRYPHGYVPPNDPRRLARDVDMRSPDGKRFADLYDALALEFVDADPARLRDIAILRFAAEKALAVGNFEDVVRLHNTVERKETRLRAMLKAKALGRGAQRVGPASDNAAPPVHDLSQLSSSELDRLYALLKAEASAT